ncbi:MAG: 3-oxoacyl-ACP reductase FabG [Clostridia bacterium]|nr:3-oxoacyl-ACP reductase FabG [Clostridia bacterium]
MKTALITGGSGGIGSAIVKEFVRAGYAVAFTYYQGETRAHALIEELSGNPVLAIKTDVTVEGEVQSALAQTVQAFHRLDVLVNCAGISHTALLQDETEESYAMVMDTNLKSTFLFCKAVAPYLVSQRQGSIVNVSSVWGVTGACMESLYSASKAGMIGLTKALAKELGLSGITVNAVAPGMIDTPMNAQYTKEEVEDFTQSLAIPRMGTGEEVAKAVRFLAEATYVTGQVLAVDGGLLI